MARPNMGKNPLLRSLCHHRTLNDDSFELIWMCYQLCSKSVQNQLLKIRGQVKMVKKDGDICVDGLLLNPVLF